MSNQPFTGRGERTARKILEFFFPNSDVSDHFAIEGFVKKEIYNLYKKSYKNASIDLAMLHHNKLHAIRIQDIHHTGDGAAKKDSVQRKDMENNGVTVIDIHERDAPYLFQEEFNYLSALEVLRPLEKAGVKP